MFINQNADKIQNIFVNPIILEHRPEFLPVIDKASTPVINKIKKPREEINPSEVIEFSTVNGSEFQ